MPRVTEEQIDAFAHCPNPRCDGASQKPVKAVRVTAEFTYSERGGDMPGVESSTVHVRCADEGDRACPECGRVREVSEQKRVKYEPLSGHDPAGLLAIARGS